MKTHTLLALICLFLLTPSLFGQTPSPVPEEARKHFVMGVTLFKDAKTADELSQVTREFKQAAELAPQWPEARYNLALARESAGDYAGAMDDLKLYLRFTLSGSDARTVQDKVYALEAKAGAATQRQVEKQKASADAARAEEARYEWLLGRWMMQYKFTGPMRRRFTVQATRDGNQVSFTQSSDGSGVYPNGQPFNETLKTDVTPVVRATLTDSGNIKWQKDWNNSASQCPTQVGWQDITMVISSDRRTLSFSAPSLATFTQPPCAPSGYTHEYTITR